MNSDKCDGAVRVDLKDDKNIKSTINTSTIDESPLVKLVKIQDNKQLSVHNRNHTGEKSSSCDVSKKAKIAAHSRSQTGEKTFYALPVVNYLSMKELFRYITVFILVRTLSRVLHARRYLLLNTT